VLIAPDYKLHQAAPQLIRASALEKLKARIFFERLAANPGLIAVR
jgi:hypothetical protein